MRDHRRGVGKQQLHFIGQQRGHHRPTAFVRHMSDVGGNTRVKQCGRQMQRVTDTGRTVGHATVGPLGQRNQFAHARRRDRWIDDQDQRFRGGNRGHWREIAQRIKRQPAMGRRIDGKTIRSHQQRITIRRGSGHHIRPYNAVGTGPVIDDERLSGLHRDLLTDDTCHRIGGARSKADNDAHRTCRIIGGLHADTRSGNRQPSDVA